VPKKIDVRELFLTHAPVDVYAAFMTFAASIPTPTGAASSDPSQDRPEVFASFAGETDLERTARQVRALRRFAEIGLNAAEALEQRVVAAAAQPEPAADEEPDVLKDAGAGMSLALHRLSRMARLSFMLENRIIKHFRQGPSGPAPEPKPPAAAAPTEQREPTPQPSPDSGTEAAEPQERLEQLDRLERLRATEIENLLVGLLPILDGEESDEVLLDRLYAEFAAAVMAAQGRVPDWAEMYKAASTVLAGRVAVAGLPSIAAGDDTRPEGRAAPAPEPPSQPSGRDPP
jgi:hypothetical protein